MKIVCIHSIRSYLDKPCSQNTCRFLLIITLVLLSGLCHGWKIKEDGRVYRGSVQLHYPADQNPTPDNITLHVNPEDLPLFVITLEGQLFINNQPVVPPWLEAWLSQGSQSVPGVVNTQIFPPSPLMNMPVAPAQITPVINDQALLLDSFPQYPQQMNVLAQQYMFLAQQVQTLTGQLNQFTQESGQMISQTQHQQVLTHSVDFYTELVRAKDDEISKLNEEIESLKQSLLGATAPPDPQPPTEITPDTDFPTLLVAKNKDIEEKKKELKRLQQKLKENEKLLAEKKEKVEEQENQLRCLECERDEARKAADEAKKEAAQSKKTSEKLKSQVDSQKVNDGKEIAKHKSKAAKNQGHIDRLRAENEQLREQLNKASKSTGKLQQDIEELKRQQESLQHQAKKSDERADDLQAEKEGLDSELKQKEEELKKERDKVERQKKIVEKKVKELEEMQRENQEHLREVDRIREENRKLEADRDKKLKEQKDKHETESKQEVQRRLQQQQKEHEQKLAQIRREHKEEKKKRLNKRKESEAAVRGGEKKVSNTGSLPPVSDVPSNPSPSLSAGFSAAAKPAEKLELSVDTMNGAVPSRVATDLSAGSLLQSGFRVRTVGGVCHGGSPDMDGGIDIEDFNLDDGRSPDRKNDKEKSKSKSGQNRNHPPREPDAPTEDIAPSAIAGTMAESIKSILIGALPAVCPAVFVGIISSIIAYRLGRGDPQEQRNEWVVNQSNFSSSMKNTSPAIDLMPVETSCDWLGAENKFRPLCLYLMDNPDRDTAMLLGIMNNISFRFPDTLMYPVFFWGYWSADGASSLNFKELQQMVESASLAKPFNPSNLYIHTLKLQDFYQDPVARQALILRWLLNQWRNKTDPLWNDIAIAHSAQQLDGFPALLGIARFGSSLHGTYNNLRQRLAQHQIKKLVPKLLALVRNPDEGRQFSANTLTLTLFELKRDSPLVYWGTSFETKVESNDEPRLLQDCSSISVLNLRQVCFSYLLDGVIWKAKIIGGLQQYITGTLPVLEFSDSEVLLVNYPEISELQQEETITFIMNWLDTYHSHVQYLEKKRFIRAALVLAGIYNKAFQVDYDQLLKDVWLLQKQKNEWTDRTWTDRLLIMKRTPGGIKPELTFRPRWSRYKHKFALTMIPEVPGEELPGTYEGGGVLVSLPKISTGKSNLYAWSERKRQWGTVIYTNNPSRPVAQGDKVSLYCGVIYGMGPSEKKLDVYFGYNKNCMLRRTHFGKRLNLPE